MDNNFDFQSNMSHFMKHLKSSENLEMCEPFQNKCQHFSEIAKEYKNMASCLYNQAEETVVRAEYSVMGTLPRGYYYPSPVIDIVIGNCNRGKLLKRLTAKSNPTYNYGFDRLNRLVVARNLVSGLIATTEYIIYQHDIALGITFSSDHFITCICEVLHEDGKIKSFWQADFVAESSVIFNLHYESFTYDKFGIKSTDFYMYNPAFPVLEHQQYYFQHDAEGYLSKYSMVEYEGETVKKSVWDGHLFDIRIKRKV